MNVTAITKTTRDLALLLTRIGLGILMIQHARLTWDFSGGSLDSVVKGFDASGVPLPEIAAPANLLIELIGGIAIIAGLGVPIVGLLMAANMAGAWVYVHWGPDLYDPAGPALVIAIGVASLVLVTTGSGRLGLDHVLLRRTRFGSRFGTSQQPLTAEPAGV